MNPGHYSSNTGGGGSGGYVPFGYLGQNSSAVASSNWRERPPTTSTEVQDIAHTTGTKAAYYGSMSKRGRGRGGSMRGRGGTANQLYQGLQRQEVVKKAQGDLEFLEKEERKKLQAALEDKIEKLTETMRERDLEIRNLKNSNLRFEQAATEAAVGLNREKKARELQEVEIENIRATLKEVENAMGLTHALTTPPPSMGESADKEKDELQSAKLAEMVFRLQQIKTAYTLQMDALLDRIGEVEAELAAAKDTASLRKAIYPPLLSKDERKELVTELNAEKEENRKLRESLVSMEDNYRMMSNRGVNAVGELEQRLKQSEAEKLDVLFQAKCIQDENQQLKERLANTQQANREMMEQFNRGRRLYRN